MAVPSKTYFPQSMQERAAWCQNFSLQFQAVAVSLGFTAADITSVQHDVSCYQSLALAAVQLDAYASAVRHYRISVTEGAIGEPTPAFPAAIDPTPNDLPPAGIFQRLIELVDRIRAAPAYTDEIGAALGILPSPSSTSGEGTSGIDELKPVLKAVPMPGNVVQVKFTRGQTDGIDVQVKVDNAESWSRAGRFFKSPASLNIPDGTGLPHAVEIRARFLEGNDPVGQNSDTINVVTLP